MLDPKKIWEKLETEDTHTNGYARLRVEPEACCDVFVGLKKPDNERCLILEVGEHAIRSGTRYPMSNSFEVYPTRISPHKGKVRITLLLKNNRFIDIFTALLIDQVKNILMKNDQKEVIDDFVARLFRWQSFFQNNPEGLSEESQNGLFGEIWFLRNILMPRVDSLTALNSWVGPTKANQDFQLLRKAIEVKTTTGMTEELNISNKRQLDSTGVDHLYLLHVSLDARAGDGESLPDLVKKLRSELDEQSVILFEERLIDYGYLDVHSSRYGVTGYIVRKSDLFEIKGDFPRITEQNVMQGITEVSYSVSIGACIPYSVPLESVFKDNFEEI